MKDKGEGNGREGGMEEERKERGEREHGEGVRTKSERKERVTLYLSLNFRVHVS